MSTNAFSATYSPEDNNLRLYAVHRLDAELYARVKAAGFIFAPKQDLFVAPCWTPQREDLLLDLCGEIGDEDTSLVERAEERAERFETYQEHRAADAERAHAAVSAIADGIPLGQPILVGHHSERHARRDQEKIENGMRRAVNAWKTSEYWKRRAAGALSHAKYKELPAVRSRRIKTLGADLRKVTRERDAALTFSRLWQSIEAPVGLDDCTDEVRLKRALYIANRDHISRSFTLAEYPRPEGCTSTYEGSQSLWGALDSRTITPGQAAAIAVPAHARTTADRERWIEQLENRLIYERAMLAESGGYEEPKRASKADLPILNYPGTVSYRNMYHHHEVVTGEAVPITKAGWASIDADYKGTRVSGDGTHRVRVTMMLPGRRHELCAVYLSDSKTHKRPAAEVVTAKAEEEDLDRQLDAQERHERVVAAQARVTPPSPQAKAFQALEGQLKAGVKVVVAPQLFPTPRDLARRMVSLAAGGSTLAGKTVLEPSAGTGELVRAIWDNATGADLVTLTAVEINGGLCSMLEELLCKTVGARESNFEICQADFLTMTPEYLGTFDAVVMNPPFGDAADIAQIKHAMGFLKPGGVLVALCAGGPRQCAALKPLASSWEDLPEGSFRAQGTNARVSLLVIRR